MELVGAETTLEFSNERLVACVCPDDCVVKWFSGGFVPDEGRLALVCETDCFDGGGRVALFLEFFNCVLDAGFDRGYDLEGVMFMPSFLVSVCFNGKRSRPGEKVGRTYPG